MLLAICLTLVIHVGSFRQTLRKQQQQLERSSVLIDLAEEEGRLRIKLGLNVNINLDDTARFATYTFENLWHKTGWNVFRGHVKDHSPMGFFVLGFLEGSATAHDIHVFFKVNSKERCQDKSIFRQRLKDHYSYIINEYINLQISDEDSRSSFVKTAGMFYAQLLGMFDGYQHIQTKSPKPLIPLDFLDFLCLNSDGQLYEFEQLFYTGSVVASGGRCTAAVALVRDEDGKPVDLLAGHTTWEDPSEMILRYYKYYTYGGAGGNSLWSVQMSSYPGFISSTDDWTISENPRFLVTETTLNIQQPHYKRETGNFVPDFIRVLTAHLLTMMDREGPAAGRRWARWFTQFSPPSETYATQWVFVDLGLFKSNVVEETGVSRMKDCVLVLEVVPGVVVKIRDEEDEEDSVHDFIEPENIDLLNLGVGVIGFYNSARSDLVKIATGCSEDEKRKAAFERIKRIHSVVDMFEVLQGSETGKSSADCKIVSAMDTEKSWAYSGPAKIFRDERKKQFIDAVTRKLGEDEIAEFLDVNFDFENVEMGRAN